MTSTLETARQAYNRYVKDVVSNSARLSLSDIETLSFAEIAENIERKEVLNEYCHRAISMLEENLREHYKERPCSIELMSSGELSELMDWQRTAQSWESAVLSLALKCQQNQA